MIEKMWRIGMALALFGAVTLGCDSGDDAGGDAGAGGAGGGGANCPAGTPGDFSAMTNPLAGDADAVAAGQAIYAQSCATCHGADGLGDGLGEIDPMPTDFTQDQSALCDGYMFWRTTTGPEGGPAGTTMTAYGDSLSDDEIWQVITYIRAFAE